MHELFLQVTACGLFEPDGITSQVASTEVLAWQFGFYLIDKNTKSAEIKCEYKILKLS